MIFCAFFLILFLEPTVREQLDQNDLRHCYVFFESTIPTLSDEAMFKVLS